MKMEAPTTQSSTTVHPELDPHSLGREFVRQYYTMLNQAPDLLYKFYSEDSSLVHGTQQDAVYGLGDIGNRFISLNFQDCHAKIRQVDSLETLERGVVVQVTGELSNNRQPPRRFFQTIILAPQSPTNYYVRNDIFRYLDEVYTDDEDSVTELDRVDVEVAPAAPQTTLPVVNPDVVASTNQQPLAKVVVEPSPKQINGHPEEKILATPTEASVVSVDPTPPKPQPTGEGVKLSWASRVADSVHMTSIVSAPPAKPVEAPAPPPTAAPVSSPPQATAKSPKEQPKRQPRPQKKFDKEGPVVGEGESPAEEPRKSAFADDQQVFVGNLPQDIAEDELKKFFSVHGNIIDVRINRTNQKSGAGRTPNYGFVTFDDSAVVKKILSLKPVYYTNKNGESHRFNVEEKRSVGRNRQDSRGPGGPNKSGGFNAGMRDGFPGKREDGINRRDRRDGPRDRPFGDRSGGGGVFGSGGEGKERKPATPGGGGNRPVAKR